MNPTMQEVVPFTGDHFQIIPWNAFTNSTANALRRLFHRCARNETWMKGVTYDVFVDIRHLDLTDIKHVGDLTAKQIVAELIHAFALVEKGHEFISDDPLLTDLITFWGDPNISVIWDNFSSPVSNSLQRMLMRVSLNDSWNKGLKYSDLEGLMLSDLRDTAGVGQGKIELVLQDLYRVFTTLDAEGLSSSVLTLEHPVSAPYVGRIDQALDFEEVVSGIYFAIDEILPIDPRSKSILYSRLPIFADELRTLDEIGHEWNVTRERIRQIESKYLLIRLENLDEKNSTLIALVDCMEKSETEEDFVERAKYLNLVGSIILTSTKLKSALKYLGMEDLFDRVVDAELAWTEIGDAQNALIRSVKKFRTKFGLLDLDLFQKASKITEEQAMAAVLAAYPRSIRVGNLVLARTQNKETSFENLIGKQLFVFKELQPTELLIGVERMASFRQVPMIGTEQDQVGLIKELCGENPSYDLYQINSKDEPDLNDTDNWFIEIFRSSATGMLHRNEVTDAALRDGKNLATVNIFLLYNPLLRSVGAAVMALADCKISEVDAGQYAQIAKAAIEPTELEWEFYGSDILIRFIPNLNTMAAGVLFPSNELKDMIKEIAFDVTCDCGGMVSEQQFRLRPPSFWTGFTAAIKHMTSSHFYIKGEVIEVVLRFDEQSAVLRTGNGS